MSKKLKWSEREESDARLENDRRDAHEYAGKLICLTVLGGAIEEQRYSAANLTDDCVFELGRYQVFPGEYVVETIAGNKVFPGYTWGRTEVSSGYPFDVDDYDYVEQGSCRSLEGAVKHCILGYLEDELGAADIAISEEQYERDLSCDYRYRDRD